MTTLEEQQLFDSFRDKDYRDAFVEEHLKVGLAYQIRALREKFGWTQEELAFRTGKAQETISQLENPDYGRFTTRTLLTLASAFDLALSMHFVSFGALSKRAANLTPELIAPPDYGEERQMSFAESQTGSPDWVVSTEHLWGSLRSVWATALDEDDQPYLRGSVPEVTAGAGLKFRLSNTEDILIGMETNAAA